MRRAVALFVVLQFCSSSHQTAAQVCGLTYTNSTGVITSPNYPLDYNKNDYCLWKISMPLPYSGISLRFTEFITEPARDVLEVRNGSTSSSPLVNLYSGYTIPATVSITGNNMWIQFTCTSDGSIRYPGFRAEWSPNVRSWTYTTSSGVITSPNYPSDYNNNDNCVWIIRMPSTSSGISLRFTAFYTEPYADILEIRRGDNQYGSLIGTYSGTRMPSPFSIPENSIWIKFTSDSSITGSGFRAEWSPPGSGSSNSLNVGSIIGIIFGISIPIAIIVMIITACKRNSSAVGTTRSPTTPLAPYIPPPGTHHARPPPPYIPPPGMHHATPPPPYTPPQQGSTLVYVIS